MTVVPLVVLVIIIFWHLELDSGWLFSMKSWS
jgi:hypothetical protein